MVNVGLKTYCAKAKDVDRKWYLIDAKDKNLGRLATAIANILRGKNKVIFTPHVDCGDFVIVVNADKIRVSGNKLDEKMYYRHSGYVGNLKSITLKEMLKNKPEFVLRHAVWGMLPHNILGRRMIKKLKIYAGENHPHQAQKPEILSV